MYMYIHVCVQIKVNAYVILRSLVGVHVSVTTLLALISHTL